MALTIDDGPSEYTVEIMQILKANNATVTFFIIGSQVAGREQTLQDLIRNGNELGNHAMHDEPSRPLSDTTLVEQIHSLNTFDRVQACLAKGYVRCRADRTTEWFLAAFIHMIRRFPTGVSMRDIY